MSKLTSKLWRPGAKWSSWSLKLRIEFRVKRTLSPSIPSMTTATAGLTKAGDYPTGNDPSYNLVSGCGTVEAQRTKRSAMAAWRSLTVIVDIDHLNHQSSRYVSNAKSNSGFSETSTGRSPALGTQYGTRTSAQANARLAPKRGRDSP